ncbi:MFS transporter [Bradyrhizobium embrapense]|uniref:MFS transporter n=1 Tax=Bradyrhizobium embrapense TaxID=630921 RepID=UPI0007C47024
MTQLAASADLIALVQTALLIPIMLIALPAGAIADMHDRRLVTLTALAIELLGSVILVLFERVRRYYTNSFAVILLFNWMRRRPAKPGLASFG